MTKVTITASEIAEGKVVLVSTDTEGTETVHTLTAEEPTLEVLVENTIVTGIEESDAEEEGDEEGDDE